MTDLLVPAIVAALVSLIVALLMKPKAPVTAEGFKLFDVASALIVLYEESGEPRAKVFPYRLQARKDWDVEWIILDPMGLSDPAGKDVEIKWDAAKGDPLKEKVKGKKRIKSKVKGEADGTYTYKVLLGTTEVADPDLEIVF